MIAEDSKDYMPRFHFLDASFLGHWYPKGLTAKRIVLMRQSSQGLILARELHRKVLVTAK